MKNNPGNEGHSPWYWLVPLVLLAVSLLAAFVAYPYLPAQIPIHWGLGVTRYAGKAFIFVIALLPALIFWSIRASILKNRNIKCGGRTGCKDLFVLKAKVGRIHQDLVAVVNF